MNPPACQRCGRPLEAGLPLGICPRCLLEAGQAPSGSATSEASAATGARPRSTPPAPEALAPHFPGLAIESLIAVGGMGAVYRAEQRGLARKVALKILDPLVAAEPGFAERFQREARTLAGLSHPGLVTVHDFGQAGPHFFFLMEFVDGASLRQMIGARSIEPRAALSIVAQVCDALQYAHDRGVVHRDIKPENILVDRAGRVRILDFGLSKVMGKGPEAPHLTRTHQVMGTPHYMAPEQWEKPLTVDHRADIYALGVVFYELLTGELPLGRFAPPSRKVEIDVRLDEVVLRTLEKEPALRYQQASEVRTDIDAIGRGRPAASPPPRRQPTSQPASQTPRPLRDRSRERRLPGPVVALITLYFLVSMLGAFMLASAFRSLP
jgi:serine/threonine protein kinase